MTVSGKYLIKLSLNKCFTPTKNTQVIIVAFKMLVDHVAGQKKMLGNVMEHVTSGKPQRNHS